MRLLGAVLAALLILTTVCGLAMAQTTATPPPGYLTNSGTVISPPLVAAPPTTPQAAFVNQSNAAEGATNATGDNLAGATNATIGNVPGVSFASGSQLVLTTPGTRGMPAQTAEEQSGITGSSVLTSGTFNPGTFNPGVGLFSSAYTAPNVTSAYDQIPNSGDRSLAELAAESRQRTQQAGNVRSYTNQDIQRMNQQTGVTSAVLNAPRGAGGMTAATTGAGSTNAGQPATAPAGIASGAAARSPFSPRMPIATEQTQTSENPAESQAGSAPAVENSNQVASNQPQQRRLPATGSPLPLIAFLGILAGAASILCRK